MSGMDEIEALLESSKAEVGAGRNGDSSEVRGQAAKLQILCDSDGPFLARRNAGEDSKKARYTYKKQQLIMMHAVPAIPPLANRAARGPIEEAAGETAHEHREEKIVDAVADIITANLAQAQTMTANLHTAARASEETMTATKTEIATERRDEEDHLDQEAETAETETAVTETEIETAAARGETAIAATEAMTEETSTEDQADAVMMTGTFQHYFLHFQGEKLTPDIKGPTSSRSS